MPGPHQFSAYEQALRELWNKQVNDSTYRTNDEDNTVLNVPSHAPGFRPDPNIVGSELSRIGDKFFKIAPELKGKVTGAKYGTSNTADSHLEFGRKMPLDFGNSNLLGITNSKTNKVDINPSLGDLDYLRRHNMTSTYGGDTESPESVLGHEFTHVAGHGESEAQIAGKLISLLGKRR